MPEDNPLTPELSATEQPETDQPEPEQPLDKPFSTEQPVTDPKMTEQPAPEQPETQQFTSDQAPLNQPTVEPNAETQRSPQPSQKEISSKPSSAVASNAPDQNSPEPAADLDESAADSAKLSPQQDTSTPIEETSPTTSPPDELFSESIGEGSEPGVNSSPQAETQTARDTQTETELQADGAAAPEPSSQPEEQTASLPNRGRSRRTSSPNRPPSPGLTAPTSSKLTLAQSFKRSRSIAKVAGSQLLRETGEGLVSFSEWLDSRTSEADTAAAANVREGLEEQFSGSWQSWGNLLAKLKAPLPKQLRRLSDTSITGILVGLLVFLLLAFSSLFQSPSSSAKVTEQDRNGYDIQAPLSRKTDPKPASSSSKLIQSRPSAASRQDAAKDSNQTLNEKQNKPDPNSSSDSTAASSATTTGVAKTNKKSISAANFFGEEAPARKAPALNKPASPTAKRPQDATPAPMAYPYGAPTGYGYGTAGIVPAPTPPSNSEAYPPGYPAPYPYPPYFYPPQPYPGSEAPNPSAPGQSSPGSQGQMPMAYPGYGAYPYPYPAPGYPFPYGQQPGSYPPGIQPAGEPEIGAQSQSSSRTVTAPPVESSNQPSRTQPADYSNRPKK